jgi:2-methylcitrate dehydratase PrpD
MTKTTDISPLMATLSRHMAQAPSTPLPAEVAEKAKHHILDTLGAMVSGARLAPGRLAIDYVRAEYAAPQAIVPGSDVETTAVNAALAGGICAHADETDDSHPRGFCHPGCAVVPAALAMGLREGRGGNDLIRAVVLGYDVGPRTTMALDPLRFYGKLHRSTHAVAALFGAAAAAGAMMRLEENQCRWLLSYAAQQASGIATWARDEEHIEKAFDFGGMNARNGVEAAALVAAGFTGVEDVFSGPRNFFEAFGGTPDILTDELGSRFEIMDTHIKKWSIGSPAQAPLAALEAILHAQNLGADDIARIEAHVPDVEADIVDSRAMPDICLQYLFAVMVLDGRVGFASSHDYDRMNAADVRAVVQRIALIPAPDLPRRQGRTVVITHDGRRFEDHVSDVRGTTANPMSREEVVAKALDLMAPVLGTERADAVADCIMTLEEVADLAALKPLLRA